MTAQQKQGSFSDLLPLLVQTGVGIIILLIFWLVVVNLPMLDEIDFPLDFTLAELIAAVLLLAITAMLVNFGNRMELRMAHVLPSFPQAGNLVKILVFIIATLIVYTALRPLVLPYINDLDWIYHLVFLLVVVGLLGFLGYSIYINMEQITLLFTSSGTSSSPVGGIVCNKCGEKNKSQATFCSYCGAELPRPPQCNSCGRVVKPGAKFCPSCGSGVSQAAGEAATATRDVPSGPTCPSCGTELKEGAKFCPSCGTPQG